MTVNPLPPQAYTKETLQKAYTWLLTQNASVKEMVNSQDMLISLYLKAQRSGDSSLETPSIQNFKQELKNLAGLIGDLQPPTAQHQQAPPPVQPTVERQARHSMPQTFIQSYGTHAAAGAPGSSGGNSQTALTGLDEQSIMALQEVKMSLNLSSDLEALRALISLGYRQFKKI
jgi:hypothetical protein